MSPSNDTAMNTSEPSNRTASHPTQRRAKERKKVRKKPRRSETSAPLRSLPPASEISLPMLGDFVGGLADDAATDSQSSVEMATVLEWAVDHINRSNRVNDSKNTFQALLTRMWVG